MSNHGFITNRMANQQHVSSPYELMNNQYALAAGGRGRNNSSHGGIMRGSMFSRRDSGSNSSARNSNHNRSSSQGSRIQIYNLTSPYRENYNISASNIEQTFMLGAPQLLNPFGMDASCAPQQDFEVPIDANPFTFGQHYRTDRYPIGSPVINRS